MKTQGLIVLLILLFVYRTWFLSSQTLSSGDWPYLYLENIQEFSWSLDIRFLWLAPYYQILSKVLVQYIGIPWESVERLLWFWPFLFLTILSSYYLTKSWIGVLIYTTNTYILMVVSGGQMGVALGYSLAPLVLKNFIDIINNPPAQSLKLPIVAGLLLALQLMFDPRIAYVTMFGVSLYYSLYLRPKAFISLGISFAIALTMNLYWIIPLLFGNLPQKYEGLGNIAGFDFLSFADFSHALSLLHPNWPENIFGKTYFLQPEFLLLPILAYSSLLFLKNSKLKTQNNQSILFFTILGLVGTFLAKGNNEPFGEINQFLFQYIPGMSMFRDPSKFYLLTVISYCVLIPFSLTGISKKVSNIKFSNYILLATFIIYWSLLIKPAILGQLGGTFKPHTVPQEYISLKNFIRSQKDPFNTLWVPKAQRYAFYLEKNQAISADQLLKVSSVSAILNKLQEPKIHDTIKNLDIKYIIVPYDSQKEIFLKDRKYEQGLYNATIASLQKLVWIKKEDAFGNVILFRVLE